jgi:hypothetical protein
MSDFGFCIAFALLMIMFAPVSCERNEVGDRRNLASSIVNYLDRQK